ncbi:MAG: inorganic phosphate transporter, partial [Bacteroidales bacterium]|nr:inorganic phosphate transporter [Bacteroidales bacterium]
SSPETAKDIGEYINTSNALAIIFGILLSIVIAFSIGALVQYITRIAFSFNYKKRLKYFGAIWGGIAITAITYFILIKGAKGASFMSDEAKLLIKENTLLILGTSFVAWTILLQLLNWIIKLNVLKLIVLVGTFALAMAFAGNDLVNFIGVPLAGYESFKEFLSEPSASPDTFLMEALTGEIKSPTIFLIIAGFIMVLALWFSRKARYVTKTEIGLSRQDEGSERFGSSMLSRSLVRSSINFGNVIRYIIPKRIQEGIARQFDKPETPSIDLKDVPSFDLLRASVNLVVASIIISFATSLRLPLSTTYVTFMVAMGSSLSDKAWDRESAVYRITGVLSVIGGWFFTAISAFTVAFLIVYIIHWGNYISIGILLIIALILIIKTHVFHKKREKKSEEYKTTTDQINSKNIFEKCTSNVANTLNNAIKIYNETIQALVKEDLKKLKSINKEIKEINKKAKYLKDNIHNTIIQLQEDSIETGHYYVQVLDYLREIAHCITFIIQPSFEHINNNHKGLIYIQVEELNKIRNRLTEFFNTIQDIIQKNKFTEINHIIDKQQEILNIIEEFRKTQIRRIKNRETGTKNSMLYLGILSETKNLLLNTINLLKAQRDFVIYQNKKYDNY